MHDNDSRDQREVATERLNRFLESTDRLERFVHREAGRGEPTGPTERHVSASSTTTRPPTKK